MKKIVIVGSAIAVFLMCIQGYWFAKTYDANATAFDHAVSTTLFTVADTMSEHATVEKRSSNYFYVTTKTNVSGRQMDAMIQQAFAKRNMTIDYEIGVYNAEDDTLVYANVVKSTQHSHSHSERMSHCADTDDVNKNFAVLFPSRKSYLLGKMDLWIFATFILIILSGLYYHWVAYSGRSTLEVVNPHQIRLGNSCLDFHNQYLEVNATTYRLTHKENQILKLLFENPNQVVDRATFLQKVWEKDGFFVARSMDVFISKVRKYLQPDKDIKIENLRSIGYRLHVKK